MVNIEQFITDRFVMGFCRAEELEEIKIKKSILRFEYGKKPSFYMKKAKTIIIVGNAVDFSEDVFRRGITKCVTRDDYPAYKAANQKIKEIASYLKNNGYKAVVTSGISYKNAAVLAGLGVWGKNSLVINKEYGTSLRFAVLVTNWLPEEYGQELKEDYCNNCKVCLEQ